MERIVLNYLSGSKAGQTEEISLRDTHEISVGRDPACTVSFSETDSMVGRQHLKLTRNPAAPDQFLVTDLNSRNGAFLNGYRINGTVALKNGDVLQCGGGGPELRFHYFPETEPLVYQSGPAATAPFNVPPPQLAPPASPNYAPQHPLAHLAHAQAAPPSAGRRLTPEAAAAPAPAASASRPSPKKRAWPVWLGGGAVLSVLVLAAGWFFYRNSSASGTPETKAPAVAAATATPDGDTSKFGHSHLSGEAMAEAEKDEQRAAWRIEVTPYLTLGSGHPGKAASDFDKPDGVAFGTNGLLYATDAHNRRVQIWEVKTGTHLGEFGHGIFGGEIVDIAVAPTGAVYVTDQTLNLAYLFVPPQPGELDEKGKPLGPYDYQFKGTRFGEQEFKKLGGIAVDSRGRIYVVDAHRNEVRRFHPDHTLDQTFRFEQKRPDGDTYLHGCEGLAIDEVAGNLFIASEKDAVIEVFDRESGAYKHRFVGASADAADKPAGKHVFFGSVEGLTLAQNHLLAVDESAGHIQVFDLNRADAFNTDLVSYAAPQPHRPRGYQGFFGHAPQVDFEDKTNLQLQKQVKNGEILPGQANPPGYFCSPDSIASYLDAGTGETYIAIADQCNYRLVIYRWSDVNKAMGLVAALQQSVPERAPILAHATTTVTPAAQRAAGPRFVRKSAPPPPARVVKKAPQARVLATLKAGKRAGADVLADTGKKKKQKQKY